MSSGKYLVGQVIMRGIRKPETVKVRTLQLILDEYLLKYFNKRTDYWSLEKDIKCDVGDVVLINEIPQRVSMNYTHEIKDMLFRFGAVVCPLSGKQCRGVNYVDSNARQTEISRNAE